MRGIVARIRCHRGSRSMSFTITSGLGFTPSTKLVFTSAATASTTAWEAGASYVARRTSRRRAPTQAHRTPVNLAVNTSCLYCSKWKLVAVSKRTKEIFAALLHGCCTRAFSQESRALVYPPFAGPLRVGDAGLEPATSAV